MVLPVYLIFIIVAGKRTLRNIILRQGTTILSNMLETTDHEELVGVVRQGIAGAQWTGRRFYYYDWMEDAVQNKSRDSRGEN